MAAVPIMVQLTCLKHLYLGSSTPITMYPMDHVKLNKACL